MDHSVDGDSVCLSLLSMHWKAGWKSPGPSSIMAQAVTFHAGDDLLGRQGAVALPHPLGTRPGSAAHVLLRRCFQVSPRSVVVLRKDVIASRLACMPKVDIAVNLES